VKIYVFSLDGNGHYSAGIYGDGVPRPLRFYHGLPRALMYQWRWGVSDPHCYGLACSVLWDAYRDDMVVAMCALIFAKHVLERLPVKGGQMTLDQVFDWAESVVGSLADRVMTIDLSDPAKEIQ